MEDYWEARDEANIACSDTSGAGSAGLWDATELCEEDAGEAERLSSECVTAMAREAYMEASSAELTCHEGA